MSFDKRIHVFEPNPYQVIDHYHLGVAIFMGHVWAELAEETS